MRRVADAYGGHAVRRRVVMLKREKGVVDGKSERGRGEEARDPYLFQKNRKKIINILFYI
jgi:hypothetical protein